jgi:hypothetical protein
MVLDQPFIHIFSASLAFLKMLTK